MFYNLAIQQAGWDGRTQLNPAQWSRKKPAAVYNPRRTTTQQCYLDFSTAVMFKPKSRLEVYFKNQLCAQVFTDTHTQKNEPNQPKPTTQNFHSILDNFCLHVSSVTLLWTSHHTTRPPFHPSHLHHRNYSPGWSPLCWSPDSFFGLATYSFLILLR